MLKFGIQPASLIFHVRKSYHGHVSRQIKSKALAEVELDGLHFKDYYS